MELILFEILYFEGGKDTRFRLSQNSIHLYNWIIGIVDFKCKPELILKLRYMFTLKSNLLTYLYKM